MLKLLNKYNNLSAPVKASFWFFICGILQKGISVLTTPIFTRLLSTSEYGQFSVYTSWSGILTIFITLNLSAGVFTRGIVTNENDKEKFTASFYGLTFLIELISFIIYLIFHKTINLYLKLSTTIMICMFLSIWANSIFNFWSTRQRVDYQYKNLVIITLVVSVLKPLLGILSIYIFPTWKVEARIISLTIVEICCYSWLCIGTILKGKTIYNSVFWKYGLKFNIPLIPHYLSQTVLSSSDKIMIDRYCSASDAGIYSLAYSISMLMTIINNAISNTFSPWLYRKIRDKEYKSIGNVTYILLILIALANFCVIAVAPEMLQIFAPAKYFEAISAIPPITMTVYFMFMYTMFANFSFYFEKTHAITITSCLGAILNIILNSIFIPKFGYIAAAFTTLFCYMCYSFSHYCLMKKISKKFMNNEKVFNIYILLLISLLFLILGFGMMLLYQFVLIRYIILIVIFLILILNKNKLKQLLRLIKNK